LEYNIETMRITDEDPDGYAEQQAKYKPSPSPNDIMSRLKPQSTLSSTEPVIDQTTGEILEPIEKKVIADVSGSKLKSLLNTLKK
jgi:hypothetical protein